MSGQNERPSEAIGYARLESSHRAYLAAAGTGDARPWRAVLDRLLDDGGVMTPDEHGRLVDIAVGTWRAEVERLEQYATRLRRELAEHPDARVAARARGLLDHRRKTLRMEDLRRAVELD